MAKNSAKEDERKGRARYIDQKGQWVSNTPAAVRKQHQKGWKALEASLTPAQRKAMGLPAVSKPKSKKKK